MVKEISVLVLLLAVAGQAGPLRAEGDWEYMFAPYIWGAGLDGETGIGQVTGEVDLSFGDILETLDGGFLGHFEASKDRWTILSDIVFLDLGQDLTQPNGAADVKQTIFELAGAFEANEDLEFLFGARLVDIDRRFGELGRPVHRRPLES
jgi:hypothetical protein